MAALVMLGCSSSDDEGGAVDEPTTTGVPDEPMAMPDWCTPASPDDVTTIEQALTGTGNKLIDAFTMTDANGYRYVVANLDAADGTRLTSAEVWIFDPNPGALGALFAVSGGAKDYSSLPDATNLAGADPSGSDRLIDCLTASAQQRNAGP